MQAIKADAIAAVGSASYIYQGGLKNGWQDWGWAHRELVAGKPAQLNMSKYAGWILAHRNLTGTYGSLSFKILVPTDMQDSLEVRLGNDGAPDDAFAHLPLTAANGTPGEGGWITYILPFSALNPQNTPFDRIVFRATKKLGPQPVAIDDIALTVAPAHASTISAAAPHAQRSAKVRIDCRAPQHQISDLIYGIAFSPRHVGKDTSLFDLGATIRRWGGNPASRYNWKLGNAWNTASDWFYTNVNYTSMPNYSWQDFLTENQSHKMQAAMTLPMIGWVAKDTDSYSFSVAQMGQQQYSHNDAGNGVGKDGKKLTGPDPRTTSIPAPPAFVAQWVSAMESWNQKQKKPVIAQYILDNEPALWNSTHRDIHPQPLTYDELLAKTIAYGEAVRHAAPSAEIAGPAEWGWPAYFFSAKDAEAGFRNKPDRLGHGDVPLLAWYLQRLQERAKTSGIHILDVVDLHFYPQTQGIYGHGEQTSAAATSKRLRAVRSLWDKSYKDESWINDYIELLPRMKRLIAENYPGRKISIGEYNFGGEHHISGALALAEALGRFGEHDVHSAYIWTYPPAGSPAEQAFLAYRNYDGKGSHFERMSLATQGAQDLSLFASKSTDGRKMTAIALNLDGTSDAQTELELVGCEPTTQARIFSMSADQQKLKEEQSQQVKAKKNHMKVNLPAQSVTVIELTR